MKKILLVLGFNVSLFYSSQIKLNVSIKEKINSGTYLLKVTVSNETADYYLLPLDKNGFKAYYESEYCENQKVNNDSSYRYLSPSIMLREESQNTPIEASSRILDVIDSQINNYANKIELRKKRREKKLLKWKKKNNIDNTLFAERNYYLLNNLLMFRPKESITYNILLDLNEILRSEESATYDYYPLGFNKYILSIDICLNKFRYSDLTNEQKLTLKKYKLFSGLIKSNEVSFESYK